MNPTSHALMLVSAFTAGGVLGAVGSAGQVGSKIDTEGENCWAI
jgi:hypothetical protein